MIQGGEVKVTEEARQQFAEQKKTLASLEASLQRVMGIAGRKTTFVLVLQHLGESRE